MACAGLLFASTASAQPPAGFVGALGGVALGDETAGVYGIQAGVRAAGGLHVIGEAGQIQDVLPKSMRSDFDIVEAISSINEGTRVDLDAKLRAWHGFGGVRWALSHSRVSPFVETGVGAAHLKVKVDATVGGSDASDRFEKELSSDRTNATKPLFAAGGGLNLQFSKKLSVDAGYRYTRIFTDAPALHSNAAYGAVKLWF